VDAAIQSAASARLGGLGINPQCQPELVPLTQTGFGNITSCVFLPGCSTFESIARSRVEEFFGRPAVHSGPSHPVIRFGGPGLRPHADGLTSGFIDALQAIETCDGEQETFLRLAEPQAVLRSSTLRLTAITFSC